MKNENEIEQMWWYEIRGLERNMGMDLFWCANELKSVQTKTAKKM